MRLSRIGACLTVLAVLLAPLASSSAAPRARRARSPETFYTPKGVDKALAKYERRTYSSRGKESRYRHVSNTPKVGRKLLWPASDDTLSSNETGGGYFKKYRLRGLSAHAELWTAADRDDVSTGLKFPEGDCRNDDPRRTKITKKQVEYFLSEFENTMYPLETEAFSVPPSRNGDPKKAELGYLLKPLFDLKVPKDYWAGKGRRTVILVDNVRDENFYDTDNANTLSRVAGYYSRFISELFDRHVMTIDSFDWLGKTTENPPDNPSTDPCENYGARPFQYEGTFAHEFQHLLESYADPDGETIWVDEGLADWAQTLTGYVRPAEPLATSKFSDSHIQCFYGYLEQAGPFNSIPAENCGPENSLNLWGDQVDNEIEILADYGAAYTMMELLVDRYGADAMGYLHNKRSDGFDSLTALLGKEGSTDTALDTVHDWLLAIAIDKLLDDGAALHGSSKDLEVATLSASIDWLNDDDYMTPGAPPNGGDFVLARDAGGQAVSAGQITEISFDGAEVLPPHEVEWAVDPTGHEGDAALFSGSGDNFDRAIIDEITVPGTDATLTFDTLYNTEQLYDFAFVQVSADAGETWTSLANEHTTTESDTGPPISDNLPGLNGSSGGGGEAVWTTETFDLSAYAGQTVLLSFRYMTDGAVANPGWWIDNVVVGGTSISDGNDLAEWQSRTQVNPIDVEGFTVQLVAWTNDGADVYVGRLPLGAGHQGSLSGQALLDVISSTAENVAVIVTYDESTEGVPEYAPYVLQVNGITQPGGS